jgi:beta-phosphoglucomutase
MTPAEILPGVESFLQELQSNHIKIALGSASKNAPLILEKIGLTHYFEAIIDGNQVVHGKPNPEVFLKGATAVGVHPAKAVVFEDAVAGIDAALAGKFMAVGIGEAAVLHKSHVVIPGFENTNLAFFQNHFDTIKA